MDLGKLMAGPSSISKTTSAADTAGTVTISGKAGMAIYILGLTVSASAAPAATVRVTLTDNGTIILPLEIPAAAFAPIVINLEGHPLQISTGSDAVLTIPALGGTTVSSGTIRYMYGTP